MNSPEDPIEPWDAPMLRSERARGGPPAEVEARMLARLQASIAQSPVAPPSGPSPTAPPWTASRAARVLSYLVTFGVGAAVGAGATRERSPRPTPATIAPVATVDASPTVAPSPPSTPPSLVSEDAGVPIPAVDAGSARVAAAPRPAPAAWRGGGGDLAAETAMIDRAHAALARSQAQTALDVAEGHARRFPRGQLAENRESVAIQALVTLGRAVEARERAAAFHRRWPDGLFREQVDAALRSIR